MSVRAWLAGIFASAVLFASTAGTVIAQPPGGGRGGQGGPGGRGGMMMMGGGMGGGGGVMSMFSLLRVEKVQGEVKITDEEKAALEKASTKVREMMTPPGGGGGFQNFRNMSEEERTKMMEEMQERMKKANDAAREELEGILPPEKLSRLLGIFIQNTQSMQQVLTNPMVTDELELTDEQKEKVTKTGTELGEEMQSALGEIMSGGVDRSAIQTKMEEFRKKGNDKYAGILTEDQKKKLEELKGAEFKLSMEEMGRGMFGGGRGGRGGEGGPGAGPGAPGGRGGRGQRPGGDGSDIQ